MLETCDRNAEKDGTVILESELVFRGACVWLCERNDWRRRYGGVDPRRRGRA